MKLITIPESEYAAYRENVIFRGYKWDPQFSDSNTIARHVLVITEKEHEELTALTERLDIETTAAERFLNDNLGFAMPLKLPRAMQNQLKDMSNYNADKHIRLNRYDFHPTQNGGWAVSEINSDVPGGFAEASLMPRIATMLPGMRGNGYVDFGEKLTSAIVKKVRPNARIMLVHCSSFSDDRQVMQFLGDKLETMGYRTVYAAADHLRFENFEAISILGGNEGKIDAIIRFSPLEWIIDMKPKRWQGYFSTITTSCNHPIAVFAQTKRFPLIWDELDRQGISMKTWRGLLPETLEVKDARNREGFIFKPVWGRVGERISIKEACFDDEYEKILKDVRRHPKKYLAQRRFESRPLISDEGGAFHVCLGAFAVEGSAAGYYARMSKTPRIDSNAADIPVLIENYNSESVVFEMPHDSDRENAVKTYRTWAPNNAEWTQWARPVAFVSHCTAPPICNFEIPPIHYLSEKPNNTAIIIDLPGSETVPEGIALMDFGFRPIPLYNGTSAQPGAMPLVDSQTVTGAILWGAKILNQKDTKQLPSDAPPAFLLDSNRMHRHRMDMSVFDNSWDIYGQDLPSAQYFLKNGISNIIVRSCTTVRTKIQLDLHKILYKYQRDGIRILHTDGFYAPRAINLKRPPRNRKAFCDAEI